MAIRAITGKPGAGKTYVALDHLLKNYYKKENGEYLPSTDITIISNIEALKLEHISLDTLLEELKKKGSQDPVKDFFSKEYHEAFHRDQGQCLFVIDECQRYFPTMLGMKSHAPEIYFFFEFHRHWGYDIYLITQDKEKIAKGIRPLIETELQALPRTVSLMGEMKYYEFVDDEKISAAPRVIRPKKEVFNLYKSMTYRENEKTKKPVLLFAGIALVFILCVLVGGSMFLKRLSSSDKKAEPVAHHVKEQPKKPVSVRRFKPVQVVESETKVWVRLDWASWGGSLWFRDPGTNEMVSAKFFKHQLRRDGEGFYGLISQNDRGRVSRSRSFYDRARSNVTNGVN